MVENMVLRWKENERREGCWFGLFPELKKINNFIINICQIKK